MDDAREEEQGIEVPWEQIDPATLRRVVEEFVTREGTDYGEGFASTLDDKVRAVMRQLERGEAAVSFDAGTETVSIVAKRR